MRQILSFVFVGLFAGCHGSENPVVSPDDAMASDSSANAAKMTVSAGTAGGGSNRQVPRSHKARELVSATTNAGGLHSEKLLVETTFSKDGTLAGEYHYYLHPETNDQIREGWARRHSKTGELVNKGKYKEDERHGLWVGYRWGGKVWQEQEFSHGTLVGRSFRYYKNGQVEIETHYVDGGKEGKQVNYYENGQVQIEVHYVDGEEEGKEVYYFENGQVEKEGHYVDGKIEGKMVFYYENGQMEEEIHYVDGKKEGKHVYYDENGNVTDEDIYRDGECVELCEEND